ncbi:MAG: T9SS type A sorting domain-containing protein [Bacteroidetes bacterium]|nr:T9SS type A sorting domain-containing protein [Bacteroidota bacterium]
MRNYVLIVLVLFCFSGKSQRIGNYVSNGSFEEYFICSAPPSYTWAVKDWWGTDLSCQGFGFFSTCLDRVPYWSGCYQYPRSGESYILLSTVYWYNHTLRANAKNWLKSNLQAGKTYCVKFYVNISNPSTYGIDGIGAYFGGNEVDTVECNVALTYIAPQIQNPQGNIITDTLNWVAITGTFTANGTEKYLLIGNFLSSDNTETLLINPNTSSIMFTDMGIDDISCIPIDLEAYAGRDTTIFLNDSVYIGRENDFAIDTGCVWYKLPSTTAIDTMSGMWVKPALGTHTYVVRQELECSPLKWDTVIVNVKEKIIDTTGIKKFEVGGLKLEVYPNPANDLIKVESSIPNEELDILIIDVTGRTVLNKKAEIKNYTSDVELNLSNGVYILKITNKQQKTISKKLIIAK